MRCENYLVEENACESLLFWQNSDKSFNFVNRVFQINAKNNNIVIVFKP